MCLLKPVLTPEMIHKEGSFARQTQCSDAVIAPSVDDNWPAADAGQARLEEHSIGHSRLRRAIGREDIE